MKLQPFIQPLLTTSLTARVCTFHFQKLLNEQLVNIEVNQTLSDLVKYLLQGDHKVPGRLYIFVIYSNKTWYNTGHKNLF